jgi:hypothetical protein
MADKGKRGLGRRIALVTAVAALVIAFKLLGLDS